jgi:hypothetical protein
MKVQVSLQSGLLMNCDTETCGNELNGSNTPECDRTIQQSTTKRRFTGMKKGNSKREMGTEPRIADRNGIELNWIKNTVIKKMK